MRACNLIVVSITVFIIETVVSQQNYKEFYSENSFSLLRSPHVRMKDEEAVFRKIDKIIKDGAKKLRIVSDFDQTLTVQHVNSTLALTSYEVMFQDDPENAQKFEKEMQYLIKYVIEESLHHTLEENIKALDDFGARQKKLLVGLPMSQEKMKQLAKTYGAPLRNGTSKLFEVLDTLDVPVLVYSSGIGQIVDGVLESQNALRRNVKTAANYLEFQDGKISGFSEPHIHMFNKDVQIQEIGNKFFDDWQARSNVILMGDNLSDTDMAINSGNENILTIGFLYLQIEERLPDFEKTFDIVLIDDQTMNIPLEIVNGMLKFQH